MVHRLPHGRSRLHGRRISSRSRRLVSVSLPVRLRFLLVRLLRCLLAPLRHTLWDPRKHPLMWSLTFSQTFPGFPKTRLHRLNTKSSGSAWRTGKRMTLLTFSAV